MEVVRSIQEVLTLIATAVALVSGTGFLIWQFMLYRRLLACEAKIWAKERGIDAVDPDVTARTTGHEVTESQRLAQIKHNREPMYRELELLKQDRQYILDRLIFVKR